MKTRTPEGTIHQFWQPFYYELTSIVEIQASIERVWELIKDVNHYATISAGAITAHVDGAIAKDKIIKMTLYKNSCKGMFIPTSRERITVVDEDNKILEWQRKFLTGTSSVRTHILEKISEHETKSTIKLIIPGMIGKSSQLVFGDIISEAINSLNDGFKKNLENELKFKLSI